MALTNANTSRTFSVQVGFWLYPLSAHSSSSPFCKTLLPGASNAPRKTQDNRGMFPYFTLPALVAHTSRLLDHGTASGSTAASNKLAPQHKVRMDPKDRTLESMNMFGKRDPTQLLKSTAKRPRTVTTLDSDEIDLDDMDETPDIEIVEQKESGDRSRGGPSAEVAMTIEESEVNLKSIKKLRFLAERGGHLGTLSKALMNG